MHDASEDQIPGEAECLVDPRIAAQLQSQEDFKVVIKIEVLMKKSTVEYFRSRGYTIIQDYDQLMLLCKQRLINNPITWVMRTSKVVAIEQKLSKLNVQFVHITYQIEWIENLLIWRSRITISFIPEDQTLRARVAIDY